jgi:glutamate-ammonia-ligase adenylyltransferase
LTRARVIAGDEALARKVEAEISRTLRTKAEDTKLMADARDMRERLAAQFPGRNSWDIKYAPGGLIDLEFLAQTLQLRHAHEKPEILSTNTAAALRGLAQAGILSAKDSATLLEACAYEHALTQILRIAQDGTLDPETATPGLKRLIARAAGVKDFKQSDKHLASLEAATRKIFTRLMQ